MCKLHILKVNLLTPSVAGLFWRIHLIDIYANLISFVLVTLVSTYALALAYRNTKFVLKHKVIQINSQIPKDNYSILVFCISITNSAIFFTDCSEKGRCSYEGNE